MVYKDFIVIILEAIYYQMKKRFSLLVLDRSSQESTTKNGNFWLSQL